MTTLYQIIYWRKVHLDLPVSTASHFYHHTQACARACAQAWAAAENQTRRDGARYADIVAITSDEAAELCLIEY